MRNRQNRFRKNWLSSPTRARFAQAWASEFTALRGQTSPALYCFSIIDRCWRDLFGARASNGRRSATPGLFTERYRSLPDAALIVLEKWQRNEISLQLLFHVPTSIEVLRAQARGERCVSALISREEILEFEEDGRDFLSFLIHDLVHAQHFFADPESSQRQIKFAREMLPLVEAGVFLNTSLQAEFEYLISDMNSHVVHLLKTLKSLSDRLGSSTLDRQLERQIPLWQELNSPNEGPDTHQRLLALWDRESTTVSTTVSN